MVKRKFVVWERPYPGGILAHLTLFVKSSHLYLYSAFNNTNCNKALHSFVWKGENYGPYRGRYLSVVYHRQVILLFYLRENEGWTPALNWQNTAVKYHIMHTHPHTLHFSLSLLSELDVSSYYINPSFLSSPVPFQPPLLVRLSSHQSIQSKQTYCRCTCCMRKSFFSLP